MEGIMAVEVVVKLILSRWALALVLVAKES
jgi:hypothetical protein